MVEANETRVFIAAGKCGYHFDPDCKACNAAQDSNTYRLREFEDALAERDALIAELREVIGFLHVAFAAYAESGAQKEAIALALAALKEKTDDAC